MYIPETFKCDVCEKEHTDNNGFFVVSVSPVSICIGPFHPELAKEKPVVCGEAHLHTFISQNLGRIHGGP